MMARLLKVAGVMATIFASFFATLWALDTFGSGCPSGERFELKRPFIGNEGHSVHAALPATLESLSDTNDRPKRSPLLFCEGDIALGPPHSQHADIVAHGNGRFSHWANEIIFSSSDKTDPNTNGRSYVVVKPR
jgi:hypothetical protein